MVLGEGQGEFSPTKDGQRFMLNSKALSESRAADVVSGDEADDTEEEGEFARLSRRHDGAITTRRGRGRHTQKAAEESGVLSKYGEERGEGRDLANKKPG